MIDILKNIEDKKKRINNIALWWDGLSGPEVNKLINKHNATDLTLSAYYTHSESARETINAIYEKEH
jgi:hypothetical protein